MGTDDVGKLQKEIRSLKKQVERLEASRATFELMVDRNDKLLSRQLEQTQRQAEALCQQLPPQPLPLGGPLPPQRGAPQQRRLRSRCTRVSAAQLGPAGPCSLDPNTAQQSRAHVASI